MVNINFMGNSYKAIFQEDASKEYLENSPTLIIKQNDYYHFNLINRNGFIKYYSLLINNGSFLKNKKSLKLHQMQYIRS